MAQGASERDSSATARLARPLRPMAVVVKNRVTPKWLALVSGNMDQNLWSDSWWFNFDPHPNVPFGPPTTMGNMLSHLVGHI